MTFLIRKSRYGNTLYEEGLNCRRFIPPLVHSAAGPFEPAAGGRRGRRGRRQAAGAAGGRRQARQAAGAAGGRRGRRQAAGGRRQARQAAGAAGGRRGSDRPAAAWSTLDGILGINQGLIN